MKLKAFTILLTALLLAGCTQNKDKTNGEDITFMPPQGLVSGAESETDAESATEEPAKEQSTEEPEKETKKESDEEQAYVLTFKATTIDGEEMTSDCFSQSKLTMINVWATYCNPCLSEMPDLGEIAASYDPADFQMIGIISDVVDTASESEIQYAKDLIQQTKANYPHLLLNESLYGNLVAVVTSVPTTFFVNQEGEVLGYVVGAQKKESWEGIIDELLAEMQ